MIAPVNPRPSPIAGQWYPDDPRLLASTVDDYLEAAKLPSLPGEPIGVVAPHAGHQYSGAVAGYAFAALRGLTPKLVTIVGPLHHPYLSPVATTGHDAYETPLGAVGVDRDSIGKLSAYLEAALGFGLTPLQKDPEHSLEIELPFLQRALTVEFELLPIMIREQSMRVARNLGEGLAAIVGDRTCILIASSDLSHFHNENTANRLDQIVLSAIETLNPAGVLNAKAGGQGIACGHGAIAAVLWAARKMGADRAQVVRYGTSADVTGDTQNVVGYGAAVITRTKS